MATRNRKFGQQIHINGQNNGGGIVGERKALSTLNLKNFGVNLKQQQQQPPLQKQQQKTSSSLILEDQENFPIIQKNQFQNDDNNKENVNNKFNCFAKKSQSFTIYSDNDNNVQQEEEEGKNAEDLLKENIEAVKKELDNFLTDSMITADDDQTIIDDYDNDNDENICNVSLMNVDENNTTDAAQDDDDNTNDDNKMDDEETTTEQAEDPESETSTTNCQQSELSYIQYNNDLTMLSDYSENIWIYLLEKERQFMPNPFYMTKQQRINAAMRSILVDWLADVCDEYNMKDETFFLTINYIDRFLSKYSISRQEFQLLGTAALFIASKYEEIYPPEISEFVYITDDTFNKEQILVMERNILNGLTFDISVPTCNYFLEMFSSELSLDKQAYCLAKYLIFLSALECSPFLKYYPSEIAFCSIMIAVKIFQIEEQIPETFIKNSFLYEKNLGNQGDVQQLINERNDLMEALNQLRIYAGQHPQQVIQRKYSNAKYFNVSNIAEKAVI